MCSYSHMRNVIVLRSKEFTICSDCLPTLTNTTGWWFRACLYSYLNGGAGTGHHHWYWSLHGSEMKIRPSEAIDTC